MPVRILAADDSATMRRIVEMTFAGEPAEVVTVASGEAALRALTDGRFDVVLADLSMSGTDGYGIAHAVKRNPATANTAVIVLASQHTPFDPDRARSAGIDDHIIKPFETQALIDKVADVLRRPRAEAKELPTASARPAAPAAAAAAPPRASAPVAARPAPLPKASTPPRAPAPAPAPAVSSATAAVASHAFATQSAAQPTPAMPLASPRAQTVRGDHPSESPTRAYNDPMSIASAGANGSGLAAKLTALGLTSEQVDGVLKLSREVIEQVVWEVVPDLAEVMIREEIKRLTAE